MIISYPGQNSSFGGQRFRVTLSGVVGTFASGDEIADGSGNLAVVERADNTNFVLLCIARWGVITSGAITGPSGSGTVATITEYAAPRARFDPLSAAPFSSSFFPELTLTYRLAESCTWATLSTLDLIIDRGPTPVAPLHFRNDPNMLLISGFSVSDFNFRTNVTPLSSVSVAHATAAAGPYTSLGSISNGSPSSGVGAFGQSQLFIKFSASATGRYIRIRFVSSGGLFTFTIGNIWIGYGIDSIQNEGWQFNDRFTITQIDRNQRTDLYAGGEAVNPRESIRQFDGVASWTQQGYDKLLDLVRGQYRVYAERENPSAICFDPNNQMRDLVGQHMHAGLFNYNGNPSAQDVRVQKNGLWFYPNVPLRFKEQR